MFVVELDFEAKKQSVFREPPCIYERSRETMLQPEIVIKKGFMEKERNITQALQKNQGMAPSTKQTNSVQWAPPTADGPKGSKSKDVVEYSDDDEEIDEDLIRE
jgi:hypothetical protein